MLNRLMIKIKKSKNLYLLVFLSICTFFICLPPQKIFSESLESSSSLFSLVTKDEFQPGFGKPIGKFQIILGEVYVIHKNQNNKYIAKDNLPVFQNDTVISLKDGIGRLLLNDGSVLSFSNSSKLELTKMVFDPENNERSSYIEMFKGKAKFLIIKFMDYKNARVNIKTPTCTVGVRGSEFILNVSEKKTEVTALKNTEIEVLSFAAPDEKPMLLSDFERTVVSEGSLTMNKERLSPEEIKGITKEFTQIDSQDKNQDVLKPETGDTKKDSKDLKKDEELKAPTVDSKSTEQPITVTQEPGILISDKDLQMPDKMTDIKIEPEISPQITEVVSQKENEENNKQQEEQVVEKKHEEQVNNQDDKPLPDFPNKPK